jgi:hypothetical protein
MAGVWMSRAGTLKDHGIRILIIALGHWFDGINGVNHYSVAALPPPKVILPMPITIVITVVTVITAPIITAVVITPIITSVIEAAIWSVGVGGSANVILNLLVGLITICPLLRHREKILNRVRPLVEKFGPEGIMVAEASDKHGDGFIVVDVRDGYPHF